MVVEMEVGKEIAVRILRWVAGRIVCRDEAAKDALGSLHEPFAR